MRKIINKLNKKFNKICYNYFKKTKLTEYLADFGYVQPITYTSEPKDLIITSNYFCNKTTRRTIVNTLYDTNFKRDNKWTSSSVIGFMEEVINVYTYVTDPNEIDSRKKQISLRYNVPESRLKTQLALFIRNLENGNDKFGILDYFSPIEIVSWKYKDPEKLNNDVQNNKIPEWELNIIKEIYDI